MASIQPPSPELHESIIPMINIMRKLKHCNKSQLIKWMKSLRYQVLLEILVKGMSVSRIIITTII